VSFLLTGGCNCGALRYEVNAPLVCYLLGLARGRHPEFGLGDLAAKSSGAEGG